MLYMVIRLHSFLPTTEGQNTTTTSDTSDGGESTTTDSSLYFFLCPSNSLLALVAILFAAEVPVLLVLCCCYILYKRRNKYTFEIQPEAGLQVVESQETAIISAEIVRGKKIGDGLLFASKDCC